MCGIIGFIGKKTMALPILIGGLEGLEYRGYDSSGIVTVNDAGDFMLVKNAGKISELKAELQKKEAKGKLLNGIMGAGHTRWATHGGKTKLNAHPHADCESRFFIVHNGIIDNYKVLRERLEKQGHNFLSETDSEVIAHLLEEVKTQTNLSFEDAVRVTIQKLVGTYAIIAIDKKEPTKIVAVRKSSPVVIGIGENEYYVASDVSALINYTRKFVYIEDDCVAVIQTDGFKVYDSTGDLQKLEIKLVDWTPEQAKKGNYKHFMLKEISEQPDEIRKSSRPRLVASEGNAKLGGLIDQHLRLPRNGGNKNNKQARELNLLKPLKHLKKIYLVGCGTALFAGEAAKWGIGTYSGIKVESVDATEFKFRNIVYEPGDIVIVLSQSGETYDTKEALYTAQERGFPSYGIVNVVDSTIARDNDGGVYLHVGPEISVASTKVYSAMVMTLYEVMLTLGRRGVITKQQGKRIVTALLEVPDLMQKVIDNKSAIQKIAKKYAKFANMYYIGWAHNAPIAYEGALKLKEISYIHAEGYIGGFMKHGAIACINKNFATVAIATKNCSEGMGDKDKIYDSTIGTINEIVSRDGPVLAFATEGDTQISSIATDVIYLPKMKMPDLTNVFVLAVAMQLFAYFIAVQLERDVDQPRNLAKSVTVA